LIAGEENEVDAEMAEMLMPGWGEWAGDGTRPSKRRVRLMQELKNKKEKRQDEILQGRKDAGLKHVVINEKRDKKFSKYQVADLPFPYKNKAAYEAAIRNPLGKEWNTQSAHKAIIRPKIQVKAGTIINPIQHKR
jgi:U3 small nucleolar RNA-associated protein 14